MVYNIFFAQRVQDCIFGLSSQSHCCNKLKIFSLSNFSSITDIDLRQVSFTLTYFNRNCDFERVMWLLGFRNLVWKSKTAKSQLLCYALADLPLKLKTLILH